MTKIICLIGLMLSQAAPVSAQSAHFLDQSKLVAIADRVVVLATQERMDSSAEETEFFDRIARIHKAAAEDKLDFREQMALKAINFLGVQPSRTGVGYCLGFVLTPTVILTAKHCSLGFRSSSAPGYVLRYDLKTNEWKISRFSQQMITMGPIPKTNHPIGLWTTGPDIALVKIDSSQPVDIFKNEYDFQVEPPKNADRCFAFDWYNFPQNLKSLSVDSPELMAAVTGVWDQTDRTFFTRYMGLGMELFDRAGNYETTTMKKPGHIKPGNSGGSVVCVNDSKRISISAVVSSGKPFNEKYVGLSLINAQVQAWIQQNL